jgi:hypothetical protein
MDLERCPRCGALWGGGSSCGQCRYIAIGAGLQNLPKKKKKKKAKYVEPGSSRGFLTFVLFAGVGLFCWTAQPWKDDWEMVRAWFGTGRHHSLVGDWDVVQTMTIKKGGQELLANKKVDKSTFKFQKNGHVELDFGADDGFETAKGNYEQNGVLVAMKNMHSESGDLDLPQQLKLKLSWTGPDKLIASYAGSEAIYLRRRDKGNPITNFLRMGIKPGDSQVPGQMRGVISSLEQNIKEGESSP